MTPDELAKPDKIKARDEFDTAIEDKLGPMASAKYFESEPEIVTPTLDRYEDEEEYQTHMPELVIYDRDNGQLYLCGNNDISL